MADDVLLPIKQRQEAYIFDYPEAVEMSDKQNGVFWLADEIEVEKDKQDMLVHMTPAEYHGTTTALKLFTKYELFLGEEYWGNVVAKRYPRPEIVRMASSFAFFELNVHAPFYAKINEVLGLATLEFYNSYVNDPALLARMQFLDSILEMDDELLSLAAFSMMEGAVLYSSFAFLKHFQSNGKNKLSNVVRGINFSVRDENIHAEAGAWLFLNVLREKKLSAEDFTKLIDKIHAVAEQIKEHEFRIIDMFYEKGDIEDLKKDDMKTFVMSRLNLCCENLNVPKPYTYESNPIAEWFYKGINNFKFNDFFAGMGSEYNRKWKKTAFVWKGKVVNEQV
jgi:ribonucleotide reductase beta subunit family protein with ferritin-like domain